MDGRLSATNRHAATQKLDNSEVHMRTGDADDGDDGEDHNHERNGGDGDHDCDETL